MTSRYLRRTSHPLPALILFSCVSNQVAVGFQCHHKQPVLQTVSGTRQHHGLPFEPPLVSRSFVLNMVGKNDDPKPGADDSTTTAKGDSAEKFETSSKTLFVLDKATLNKVENDADKLDSFMKQIDEARKKFRFSDPDQYDVLTGLQAVASDRREGLVKALEAEELRSTPIRVATVDFEVIRQSLLHNFDFNLFKARVLDLFKWYSSKKVMMEYMAPYFPLVQSSGMGKTKLLWELRKLVAEESDKDFKDCACKVILCTVGPPKEKIGENEVFQHVLDVPAGKKAEDSKSIYDALNEIVKQSKEKKIILLFDESQRLLKNKGYPFRCVRWWLQLNKDKRVVAVFTGTTSRLTNFHAEPPEESTSSRGPGGIYYDAGTSLYNPFWNLCTIGLFPKKSITADITDVYRNDYERAIPYGRPLFAILQQKNKLTDETEYNVLRKMLLGPLQDWSKDIKACLSILGTRIQMGQTSVTLASNLVSKGYAVFSHYVAPAGDDEGSACIFFPTDPVCSRLAMAMMDDDFEVSLDGKSFGGRNKTFWTAKMTEIFSTGLCSPSEGDLGELAGTMYLLFCGDLIRKSIDSKYKTFSIPLSTFVQSLLKPHEFEDPLTKQTPKKPPKNAMYRDAHVSFIQVTRNYLRFSPEDSYSQDFLRDLYQSGTAFFAHRDFPKIDLVASVRLTTFENEETYVPLFVGLSLSKNKESKIANLSNNTGLFIPGKGGIRLELLFDRSKRGFTSRPAILTEADVNKVLNGQQVAKVVFVPKDDPFGITDILTDTIWCGSEISEAYSSHFRLFNHPLDEVSSEALLRAKCLKATSDYFNNMRKALLDARE